MKMEFNPDPTKQATEVLFSNEKVKPIHPDVFLMALLSRKLVNKNIWDLPLTGTYHLKGILMKK